MNAWKRLAEPVAVFTILAAVATALGAVEGLPQWVNVAAVVVVALAGAALRSLVTPVANPKNDDGVALVPAE